MRKSFYIRWSAGRSPRVHEVNPGRDPSTFLVNKHSEQKRRNSRMVINYKRLNDNTEDDEYDILTKEYLLGKIKDSTTFSKFDCKSGFWQVKMHLDSIPWTVFSCPEGHF